MQTHLTKVLTDIFKTSNTIEGMISDISGSDYFVKLNSGEIVKTKIQDNLNVKKGDLGVVILGTPNIFIPLPTKNLTTKKVYI